MMKGRNNGKKLMTVRIVKHAFEIIHLLTGENPLQVRKIFYIVFFLFQCTSFHNSPLANLFKLTVIRLWTRLNVSLSILGLLLSISKIFRNILKQSHYY